MTEHELMLAYFEYQFVSATYKELMNAKNQCTVALNSRKGDIGLMSQKKKIEHDLALFEKLVNTTGDQIAQTIKKKYNLEFQFLVIPESEPVKGLVITP